MRCFEILPEQLEHISIFVGNSDEKVLKHVIGLLN